MANRSMKAISVLCLLVMVLVMAPGATGAPTGTPVPDGQFYGNNDKANYDVLAEALGGRGTLYGKQVDDMLYLAVEVDPKVNDNVFGIGKKIGDLDAAYLISAGWVKDAGAPKEHTFDKLLASEHVELRLSCGDKSWAWNHG